jgi:hypothetical protein
MAVNATFRYRGIPHWVCPQGSDISHVNYQFYFLVFIQLYITIICVYLIAFSGGLAKLTKVHLEHSDLDKDESVSDKGAFVVYCILPQVVSVHQTPSLGHGEVE